MKSKRFWLNTITAVTMLGTVALGLDLSANELKIVTFIVAVANIVLQVFFPTKKVKK